MSAFSSRFCVFISCLFLLAPLWAHGANFCDVVVTLYGAPNCDELAIACEYANATDGECLNFTLPDSNVSALIDCNNQVTSYYGVEGCVGSPLSTATNVINAGCATTNSWYFTIVYDSTVCTAAASRLGANSLMLAMLSWFGALAGTETKDLM